MPGPRPRTTENAYHLLMSEATKQGDCLVVLGRCTKQAGHIRISVMGQQETAHRVVYAFHHGPIPDRGVIMHLCDNPRCIEITHLKLGSLSENISDMWKKKRGKIGADHGNARLTEEQVRYVKDNPKENAVYLGAKFNCSPNTILAIRKGRSWTHLT